MSIRVHSPESRNTIQWASGTSTEMFIYPADGSFADRRFLFRISSATVEAEESTFTFFEGITRHLMILKGTLELIHEGRYTKQLQPYDADIFSGEWNTRSKGKVTDFNLMLKDGATGSLTDHRISKDNPASFNADTDYSFLFIAEGEFVLSSGEAVPAGYLLQLTDAQNVQLAGDGHVVEIRVSLVD